MLNGKKSKRLRREAKKLQDQEVSYVGAKVKASNKTIRAKMEAMRHGLIEDTSTIGAPSIMLKLNPECTRSKYQELKERGGCSTT